MSPGYGTAKKNLNMVVCLIISDFKVYHVNLYKSSAIAEMGDCLATIDMGQKLEELCPLGQMGPHLIQ